MKRIFLPLFTMLFAMELCYSQNNQSNAVTVPDTTNRYHQKDARKGTKSTSNDEQTQSIDSSRKSTLYDVKVTVKELKNRILECNVRNHTVIVDQPKQFGADDLGPTPPEMLAISFGSCIVSTMQFLAYQKKISLSDITVTIEGQIDFAKAMGISNKNRAGFQELFVKISFKSNMSLSEKKNFINKILEVGATIDNVANSTPIRYEITD